MDFGSGGTNWYFEYQLVLAQKYRRRVGSGRVAMFEWRVMMFDVVLPTIYQEGYTADP